MRVFVPDVLGVSLGILLGVALTWVVLPGPSAPRATPVPCAPIGMLMRGTAAGQMRACDGIWQTMQAAPTAIPFAEMYLGCSVDGHPIACHALALFEAAAPGPLHFAPLRDRP